MFRVVLKMTSYTRVGSGTDNFEEVTLQKKMMFEHWNDVQNVLGHIVCASNEATEFSIEHIKEEDENE